MTAAAPWLVPRLRRAYAHATLALELPFAGGFEVFPHVRRHPARGPPAQARARGDARALWDSHRSPCAAVVVRGLRSSGSRLVVRGRPALRGAWTVVTTDRSSRPGATPAGVVFVPESEFIATGFRYEDLVAAVDVVVTKPGYGIISECIAAGRPMLYTSRGHFREYDVLVRAMPRYLRCKYIDQQSLLAGTWTQALDELLKQPAAPETLAMDGADVAAAELVSALGRVQVRMNETGKFLSTSAGAAAHPFASSSPGGKHDPAASSSRGGTGTS